MRLLHLAARLSGLLAAKGSSRSAAPATARQARRPELVAALDAGIREERRDEARTAAIVIEIDRFKLVEERYDHSTVTAILGTVCDRLHSVVRGGDIVARLDGPTFGIAVRASRRFDLTEAIQMAARFQTAISLPIAVGSGRLYITASVGISLTSRLTDPSGERLLQSATLAMIEAQRNGPGAIRSYSDAMQRRIASRSALAEEVDRAFDGGEIRPFFQPQISARTGEITGFETLARWHHPSRGLIPPSEFLPALRQASAMGRLCESMVHEGLRALCRWDARGFAIPRIGVNFSDEELSDPHLVDRISWELDRHPLPAHRLVVEVLETVVASGCDNVVIRNLSGLSRIGCGLDLDDFGTGNAAITSIRRFSIARLKIDRSFVTRIDEDPEQQKMVAAIVTMADRLGLETLAEGVETEGEAEMLCRLGCDHLQGFHIARPMPIEETDDWIRRYAGRSGDPIPLPARAG